ncbi:YnjH family protein [Enterobacter sp. Bisph1]|uniref:YnjH family protein n=1 Tax=Enterobacter sp. Bisph1 TaxID=1274399 RepID=UPI00057BD907|nr:YnjH family protein [Enterobacter sp. Bisph1]
MARMKWLAAALLLTASGSALAERSPSPDIQVNVPPEVFSSGGQNQNPQPCMQCCVYDNQRYSEGAVIKTEGILLQCQRDEKVISTNPLVWRRVKP